MPRGSRSAGTVAARALALLLAVLLVGCADQAGKPNKVQRMLLELFGHSPEECYQMAKTVDTEGRVVVLTTTKEHAELKRDQILAYGKDDTIRGCKGSMHATIESAD